MAAAVVGYKPSTCGRLRFAQHYLQRISVRVHQTFLPEPSVEKSRNLCVSTPRFNENAAMDNVDVSEDSGFYIEIGKNQLELNGWEWGREIIRN